MKRPVTPLPGHWIVTRSTSPLGLSAGKKVVRLSGSRVYWTRPTTQTQRGSSSWCMLSEVIAVLPSQDEADELGRRQRELLDAMRTKHAADLAEYEQSLKQIADSAWERA